MVTPPSLRKKKYKRAAMNLYSKGVSNFYKDIIQIFSKLNDNLILNDNFPIFVPQLSYWGL